MMEDVTISYWGFAAVCGTWFLIGIYTGFCIARKAERKNEDNHESV